MDSQDWDRRYQAEESLWSLEPNRWVADYAGPLPSGRALDLACGEGRNAIWLAELGWRVVGVDFSQVALDKAVRRTEGRPSVAGRIDWQHADLLDYLPDARAFDLVLVSYLHLPAADRRRVLCRAADAVSEGGILMIIGHDSANLTEGTGGPQDPAILYSAADLLAELDDATAGGGWSVQEAAALRRPVAAEGPDAVDALLLLRRDQPLT